MYLRLFIIISLITAATTLLFLPIVGNFGYAAMWGCWFVCTAAYFAFAAFVLPETKGKSLEEIEAHFAGGRSSAKTTDAVSAQVGAEA